MLIVNQHYPFCFSLYVKMFTPLQTFLWLKMTILFFLLINTNFLYLQHAIMLGVSSIFCKLTPSVWLSKMVERAFALPFTVEPILVIVRTHSTRYSRERSESLVSRHSGNKIKCFFSYLLFESIYRVAHLVPFFWQTSWKYNEYFPLSFWVFVENNIQLHPDFD